MPQRVFDAIGAAVTVTDLLGTVLQWNAGAEALYGWSRDEAVGRLQQQTVGRLPSGA